MDQPIILYDGLCGLCNRLNRFLLKRDVHDRLRFASLQSDFATKVLNKYGADSADLDTVYVVENFSDADERILSRSDAIIRVVAEVGGVWSVIRLGKLLPYWLRDRIYNLVARNRYRVFGKYEACLLPEPQYRAKFLD